MSSTTSLSSSNSRSATPGSLSALEVPPESAGASSDGKYEDRNGSLSDSDNDEMMCVDVPDEAVLEAWALALQPLIKGKVRMDRQVRSHDLQAPITSLTSNAGHSGDPRNPGKTITGRR